jgi:hypothetical protein
MVMTRSGPRSDAHTTGDEAETPESADDSGSGIPIHHGSQATPQANNTANTQDDYMLHQDDTNSDNRWTEGSGVIDVGGHGGPGDIDVGTLLRRGRRESLYQEIMTEFSFVRYEQLWE